MKRRLKKLFERIKSENERFYEILYMDDTPLIWSRWIERKLEENNIVLHWIEARL